MSRDVWAIAVATVCVRWLLNCVVSKLAGSANEKKKKSIKTVEVGIDSGDVYSLGRLPVRLSVPMGARQVLGAVISSEGRWAET